MRAVLLTLAALAVAGALGAAAVVGLGLYNVSARVGHWPGVSWVLHTTFRNSVRLRALPEDAVPDLSDPALVALGARHYATACAPCHATPGTRRTATMRAMVPAPPHIDEAVRDWQANHLHWIVFNGIKMSGMPAWPARQRSAEVWPVVAYLMRVQRGLSAAEQADLVRPAPAEGEDDALAYCRGCHDNPAGVVPRLDILSRAYLAHSVAGYLDGTRPSGMMQQALTAVDAEALERLLTHYAGLEPEGGAMAPLPDDHPGARLARHGTDDVPACAACHGPGASRARPVFPALAGQNRAYLAEQLRLWREGRRAGSDLMEKAAMDLTDADIAALADYYAALPPAPLTPAADSAPPQDP